MLEAEPIDFREPISLFEYDESTVRFAAEGCEMPAKTEQEAGQPAESNEPIMYTEVECGFWRRQFQPEPTGLQRSFDWLFGVILPIICFFADPLVFRTWTGEGPGILGSYMPFAYALGFASIVSMAVWLKWGHGLGAANAGFAGLFAIAGVISLVVGVILIPFSLLGLILLIGALGFTPFFSAVIYFRNSCRAYMRAEPAVTRSLLNHAFLLSALFSLVVPYLVNLKTTGWINPLDYFYRVYYGPMI